MSDEWTRIFLEHIRAADALDLASILAIIAMEIQEAAHEESIAMVEVDDAVDADLLNEAMGAITTVNETLGGNIPELLEALLDLTSETLSANHWASGPAAAQLLVHSMDNTTLSKGINDHRMLIEKILRNIIVGRCKRLTYDPKGREEFKKQLELAYTDSDTGNCGLDILTSAQLMLAYHKDLWKYPYV